MKDLAILDGNRMLPAGSEAAKSIQLSEIVTAVRRWWWQCAFLGITLGSAAVAAVWFTFEPVYEATALLEIRHQPWHLAFPSSAESQVSLQTQLEILRNVMPTTVLANRSDVASCPEALEASTPLKWLQKELTVNYLNSSEVCRINFRSRHPADAALVANAVMKEYLRYHEDKRKKQTDTMMTLLQDQKTKRMAEVDQKKERVQVLTEQRTASDGTPISGDKELIIRQSPLASMEGHYNAADVEASILSAHLSSLEEGLKKQDFEISPLQVDQVLESDDEVRDLRQQLATAKNQLRGNVQRMPPGGTNSITNGLARKIQDLEQQMQGAVQELRPKVTEALRTDEIKKRTQQIAELRTNIENQEMLKDLWDKRVKEEKKKLESLGGTSLHLEFAKRELLQSEDVLQRISDRMVAIGTEKPVPSQVAELQLAPVPVEPLEALPYKRMGMAFLGVFCLPFGLAFLWERKIRRISDADHVVSEVSLPVLGEVAALPSRALVPALDSADKLLRERGTFEESIDSLRVGLMLAPELQNLQTLAVTSAISQEGKTSLASSLAASLARSTNESILLIDADFRAPDLHDVFSIPLQPGLIDVLQGSSSIDEAIFRDGIDGVHVLPAGELQSNPHLLLSSRSLVSLLETLRARYRYIIVDSPPVLLASEALTVASACDGALICTMCEVSRGAQLRLAREKLVSAGVNLIGAVINGVPSRAWSYKYGGYGYGYHNYIRANSRTAASKSVK